MIVVLVGIAMILIIGLLVFIRFFEKYFNRKEKDIHYFAQKMNEQMLLLNEVNIRIKAIESCVTFAGGTSSMKVTQVEPIAKQ